MRNRIQIFSDAYDPRRLQKSVDDYLRDNVSDIEQTYVWQGVGEYNNHIVFELKNGDFVYQDNFDDHNKAIIIVGTNDPDLKLYKDQPKKNIRIKPGSSM